MFSHTFSLCIFAVVLTSLSEAIHIRTGNVTTEGQVKTDEGMRYYTTDAVLMKPVVCWEDLAKDGITVDQCEEKKIRYAGNIDGGDFQKGNVVTFPAEDYIKFGCPLPPHRPEEKESGVIFRIIRSVKIQEGSVTVYTTFIDPGEVVPTIMLHMGPLVDSSRQVISDAGLSLSAVSRVNNVGFRFRRGSRVRLFTGASLSYSMTATGGVCNFEFDIRRRRVTWEQRVEVQGSATLDWSRALSKSASNQIFKAGIPGSGFSIRIFLLGRVTAGFTAALDWEVDFDVGASATLQFGSRFVVARRVVLGIGTLNNSPITSSSSGPSASIAFETSRAASATATGFAGIRPVLALELEMPVIPDANVGVGATIGVQASIAAQEPPFMPVTTGRTIGSACSSCHIVQGTLDVEGRRVSITAEAPILGNKEFTIISTLFSTNIGTLCLFERQCIAPSMSPERLEDRY